MRYTTDEQRRLAFRDWLRGQLAELDFYQRRGDRYLMSEFARYATEQGARVEEVSLGRYVRDENPVLPTPESCRELARALHQHPAAVLMRAGYLRADDFLYLPGVGATEDLLRQQLVEIERYTYLPEAIRAQMSASLQQQLRTLQYLGDVDDQPTLVQRVAVERKPVDQVATEILDSGPTEPAPPRHTGARGRTPSEPANGGR